MTYLPSGCCRRISEESTPRAHSRVLVKFDWIASRYDIQRKLSIKETKLQMFAINSMIAVT